LSGLKEFFHKSVANKKNKIKRIIDDEGDLLALKNDEDLKECLRFYDEKELKSIKVFAKSLQQQQQTQSQQQNQQKSSQNSKPSTHDDISRMPPKGFRRRRNQQNSQSHPHPHSHSHPHPHHPHPHSYSHSHSHSQPQLHSHSHSQPQPQFSHENENCQWKKCRKIERCEMKLAALKATPNFNEEEFQKKLATFKDMNLPTGPFSQLLIAKSMVKGNNDQQDDPTSN